jgi:hypothetical protein
MHPIYASFSLGDAMLTVLWIFGFVILTWLLIVVFGDLFRDRELSGWAKALWTIFVIVFPFVGIFVYLIFRGGSMYQRVARERVESEEGMRQYMWEILTSGISPADEIAKLVALHDQGVIDDEEFQSLKARLLD